MRSAYQKTWAKQFSTHSPSPFCSRQIIEIFWPSVCIISNLDITDSICAMSDPEFVSLVANRLCMFLSEELESSPNQWKSNCGCSISLSILRMFFCTVWLYAASVTWLASNIPIAKIIQFWRFWIRINMWKSFIENRKRYLGILEVQWNRSVRRYHGSKG